jgi:hypothetical protein
MTDFSEFTIGAPDRLSISAERSKQDRIDAERWRALMASARLRMLGTAGFKSEDPNDKYRHMGLELWTQYGGNPADHVAGNAEACAKLTAYADVMRELQDTPPTPST